MHEIIQQNFIGVAILIFLILFIFVNNNFERRTNMLFLSSAICVLLFIIEEALEWQYAKMATFHSMRLYLSIIGYMLRPTTAYFLAMIISENTKKQKLIMTIPLLINFVVAVSALFTKWSFGYTASNEFVRGPLGYTPFITAGFYVLTILYMTVVKSKKGDAMENVTVSAIVVLTLIATMMESVYHFRAIQSAASGISITFYYLFLHTNQSNRDALTGALTRRRFYLDARKYHTSLSAVISLDINNLKQINDQQGHLAGDQALITLSHVVRSLTNKKASFYRTGGDEFMILCYHMSEDEVQQLIARIREHMQDTEYRCAIGYALYDYQRSLEMVCQLADSAMYENKKLMKQ